MALVRTTLSAAVAVNDSSINVASASSITAGRLILVDNEFMKVQSHYVSGTAVPVMRGQNGSAVLAHVSGAGCVHGDAADFATPPAQAYGAVNAPIGRARTIASYSASGAIALPLPGSDAVAVLNGTNALSMTLANPGVDQDGDVLVIAANGKAAHTVTITSGLGNGGSGFDVATFSATLASGCTLMACGGYWLLVGSGIANANTPVGAPLWA